MNKTIIININGTVFHIEEDAYEILKNYMTDVKRHFMNSADSLEITTDIENRIAEMFSDILAKENKQVIIEQDVNLVIDQMGRVEDFDEIYDDAKTDAYNYNAGERRLFRDPDDHLIGGVCAGMANYFNVEPAWIRLAFALTAFFAGSGILLYIILWIVIPKAVTRADRMAMKGEKLNLQGFKNNLEEELNSVRNHLNNFQQEARPFIYKLRDFITDFVHHLGLFFNGAGKILIKMIGFIILLAFFAGAIALIVIVISFIGFGAAYYNHIFPFTIIMSQHANWIYISAFLTAFIPVLSVIVLLTGALFNTKPVGRSTGSVILVIWICALGMLVYYAAKAGANFRESASFTQSIPLNATPDNVYYLKLDQVKYLTHDDSLQLDIKDRFHGVTLTNNDDNDTEPQNVHLNIERSDINQPVLEESFSAKGYDYEDALTNARNTRYIFTQNNAVLNFDEKLIRIQNTGWHAEEVQLTLKLPLNSKAIIDEDLNNRIDMNGVNVYDCKESNKQDKATSATFIMTDDGLQCKIDTVVTVKTPAQIDSAQKAQSAKLIAKLHAQIDSVKRADSLNKR